MQENKIETQLIQLGDDRHIAYCEYGDPSGSPVFYFHGTPGSRYEPVFAEYAGRKYGYRILALDRPGIGRSDYAKGRTLLNWTQDVYEVAKYLEIERFGVIGASGGGPYALACGYALADYLEFTVLMGSWGPVAETPKLWKEMAPLDQFFGKLSRSVPWAFYIAFSFLGYAAKWLPPDSFGRLLESSMSDADKELLSDKEMARFFLKDMKEAFRQGTRGPADDVFILYGEWGFSVEEVKVKVDLFHGEKDKFAPYTFAIYLDEKLPNSELHRHPEEGHLFIMRLFDQQN